MRTFHTGGVFAGDVSDQIRAPFTGLVEFPMAIPGTLIRTPEGKIAFFTKNEGSFFITEVDNDTSSSKPNKMSAIAGAPKAMLFTEPADDVSGGGVAKQRRQFKVPSYTLIYVRNSQTIKANEVIAQISTISRKTNATDEAALTIESEYEGQFYSKTLSFREKFLGDAKLMESGLKDCRGLQNPLHNDIFPFSPKAILPQNGLQSIDKIYEAWTWGYAWVLSGKFMS